MKRTPSERVRAESVRVGTAAEVAAPELVFTPGALSAPNTAEHAKAKSRADDAWRWRGVAAGPAGHRTGGKTRRAKGPPPPKAQSKQRTPHAVAAPVRAASKRVSKLAPHLEARLAAPLPSPHVPTPIVRLARQRVSAAWQADRMAAVLLLLPTLIAAMFLAALPRVKAPLERTAIVASLKIPAPEVIAVVPLPPIAPAIEHLPAGAGVAARDLAAAVPALARDIADLAPRYRRPPEALALPVPMAVHDLAQAVVALERDGPRALLAASAQALTGHAGRPPFVRQPEALAALAIVAVPSVAQPVLAALPPDVHMPATSIETAASSCRAPAGLLAARSKRDGPKPTPPLPPLNPDLLLADDPHRFGLALSDAAKAQSHDLVIYNARYMQIAYPRGDVPALFGVCTDVVIRAYRALDIDLQELVHQSRTGPTDTSIDHRRTELLRKFFATHGESHPVTPYSEDYLPGDIVTYYRPQNKSSTAHIAVVTDEIAPSGRPMIAHNRGWGVQLEDALFVDQMTGHYRFRGLSTTAVAALPRNAVWCGA